MEVSNFAVLKSENKSMNTLSYRTESANESTVNKEWVLVDAENEVLGRLATKVARLLRGKLKTNYTPHFDCGDNVIVINAEKVILTGKKLEDKEYVRHTGYPGGQRISTPRQLLAKKPTTIVEKAIKGMLPKNRLGAQLFRNLYVYAGPDHPHQAQQPKEIKLNTIK
jgi:large subunit ribosomal protein L13